MTMAPGLRKLVLTAHATSSVGWLGSVAGFLALAIAGLASPDGHMVRAVYLAMEPIGWFVLVPLSVASLLTGLIVSLGSQWGLFRHYWVLIKLLINVLSTVILLLYMRSLVYLAEVAAQMWSSGDVSGLRSPSPVLHSGAALLLLLIAVTLSVYKPRGRTRYGQRKQDEQRRQRERGAVLQA
jgi:hypothetical protein